VLPVRRYRNWFCVAELSLLALLRVNGADAQTLGAASAPVSAPAAAPAGSNQSPRSLPQSVEPSTLPPAGLSAVESDADERDLAVRDAPLSKPPTSARWLLLGVGVGTTALWWAGAYGISELWPGNDHHVQLRIPVAGPFIDLYHTHCPAANPDCSTFQLVVRTLLVTLDAIGQTGGVALVLQSGMMSTASVEAPRANQTARLRRSAYSPRVVPTPWLDGRGGGGVGLVGRF
jgi:hypothetical protein